MLIIIAILLRLSAGAAYIHAVVTGKAKPHIVSWFFWGLTALIAFGVQLTQGVGPAAFVTLALGIGPVIVFTLAIVKGLHRITFTFIDKLCAVLTAIGILLWVFTKDPMTALWLSICADMVSGVPTIIKCYYRPDSEHALPYSMSVASMIVTLISIHHWTVAAVAFPAYILGTNLLFTTLIASRVGPRVRAWQQQTGRLQTAPVAVTVEE
ncbi:MAG TPA: hypothetical protein VLF60_04935 [Candidatus Saccharimonadales bacterium]|nr:hypothetical protein [Candidatus Saccharimonadales bacterium]